MTDILTYRADATVDPSEADGVSISASIPLSSVSYLARKLVTRYVLTGDGAVTVNFGGLTNAHVVVLRTHLARKVLATLTSADGSAQVVPVNPSLVLFTNTTPVTALTLTRVSGIETTIDVLLGENT